MTHSRHMQPRGLETQARILDAAVRALVEHGYSGASTLRIQQLAGVSRGSLLHQFPSRDALLVAAVQHLAAARFDALNSDKQWPEDPVQRIPEAVRTMWSTYHQDYFWAASELWLAARHNDELRTALVGEERALQRKIRDSIDTMFGPSLILRPAYPRVREILNTSMRGVALTYAFDRRDAVRDPHLTEWTDLAVGLLIGPS
ncbi:TetR/AcrR family transcriptional regulator [Nocardia sp. NPDC004860]|uniref:TetR/AcrR family transcriptional regulator n=1 Tax=Nocardia sp. NPDC004860 TaxID=3154557 RepID=UPI0033B94083